MCAEQSFIVEFMDDFIDNSASSEEEDEQIICERNPQKIALNIGRFEGDMDVCRYREVCADVFNFTRDHGNGTGRLESRILQNCYCPSYLSPCGQSANPMLFRETRTQSESRNCFQDDNVRTGSNFTVCVGDQIAKEQHNLGYYVYYKINCICPNSGNPGNFGSKMTIVKRWNEMTSEEREYAQRFSRSRFFKCMGFRSRGR